MEIINQSRIFAPIGMHPLERIELIGKVCTKKENTITNETAEKFFIRRIHDGHCAIAEHGIEYYKITCYKQYLIEKFIHALKNLKYVDYICEDDSIYIAINYRVIIDVLIILKTKDIEYIKEHDLLYACVLINDIVKFNYIDHMLFKNSLDDVFNDITALANSAGIVNCYDIRMLTEKYILTYYRSILNVSIKFITDRGVSHEFVRHKTLSFMQESTRWCKYDKGIVFIRPYWMSDEDFDAIQDMNVTSGDNGFSTIDETQYSKLSPASIAFVKHCIETERNYATVLCDIKSAQAARAVLGQCVKTELWITGACYKLTGIDYSNIDDCPIKEKKGLIPQKTAMEAHPDMQIAMKDIQSSIDSIRCVI